MTTYRTSKRAVAYIRVSTEKQGEIGIGLEAQRAAIHAYADKAGIEIIELLQDVASGRGAKNLEARDGLNRALDLCKVNDADLLVDRLDRLSRNTKTIEEIIRDKKVNVVSVSDGHTTNPLVIASRAARAEFEGDEISRRTKQALSKKKASGMKLGNRTNLPEAQKLGAESNKIRAQDKVNEIASAIRSNDWHKLPVPALVDALNGIGLRTSRGGPWTAAALRRPLKQALLVLNRATLEGYEHNPTFGQF
jgi:DNA invertase Pin-like site-specific DNA recombinase